MTIQTKTPRQKTRKGNDWIGVKFGRLTIQKLVGVEGPRNSIVAEVQCECGTIKNVRIDLMRDGGTKSCGCLVREINSLPTADRPKSRTKISSPEAKEAHRQRKLAWAKANPKKIAAIAKRCRLKNPTKLKAEKAAFYQRHKKKIIAGQMEQYYSNARFRVEMLLRGRVNTAIRLQGARKSARTMELVGCSIEDLMKHIESNFRDGMSWDNRHTWHIDHIRPCASFDLMNPEEQKKCFHFSNLQPLTATENMEKKARLDWKPKATPSESAKDIPAP